MTEQDLSTEVNDWGIKCHSIEDFSKLMAQARMLWAEEDADASGYTWFGTCPSCNEPSTTLKQHWNDVGGYDSRCCRMCWCESSVYFQMCEDMAHERNQQDLANLKGSK